MNRALFIFALLVIFTGCRRDMADQARFDTYEANPFFADGSSARPIPAHTIAQGDLREDTLFYTGKTENGEIANVFPYPITQGILERGRQRYDIYCGVCHGATGDGNGMIVQRGFPPPPSLQLPRLREASVGHFYDVMTNGYGVMYSYGSRVAPADRWAIAAYLRVLQQRENTPLADLKPDERAKLEGTAP